MELKRQKKKHCSKGYVGSRIRSCPMTGFGHGIFPPSFSAQKPKDAKPPPPYLASFQWHPSVFSSKTQHASLSCALTAPASATRPAAGPAATYSPSPFAAAADTPG